MLEKVALLIHGWGNNSKSAFFPELQRTLETKGYEVIAPDIPHSDSQNFLESFTLLTSILQKLTTQNVSIIGHSSGGYLAAKLAEKYKTNTLVLVAPTSPYTYWGEKRMTDIEQWIQGEDRQTYLDFHKSEIEFNQIVKNARSVHVIFGLKDPYILQPNRDYFINHLREKATIQILDQYGHMGVDEGVTKLPVVENLFI